MKNMNNKMRRRKQTLYENIVTNAVMSAVKDMYGNNKRLSEGMINEGLGGGVLGILMFFLALFGISTSGSGLSSLFSSSSSSGTTASSGTTTTTTDQQQTQTTQSQPQSDKNNENLEALAKKLGLVDIETQFNGRNLKYDPQYAKSLTHYGGHVFYTQKPKGYLCKDMVAKLDEALKKLESKGYGIVVLDATRPESVQKELASVAKDTDTRNNKTYDPSFISEKLSKHGQGKAIDCTLYVIRTGQVVDMGGDFDERSKRSYTDYYKKTNKTYHNNRMILKKALTGVGMTNYKKEWWHYYI